jgi:hypothetical protein
VTSARLALVISRADSMRQATSKAFPSGSHGPVSPSGFPLPLDLGALALLLRERPLRRARGAARRQA